MNYLENHFHSTVFRDKILRVNGFTINPLTIERVVNQLKNIDPKSSSGITEIESKIFKHCSIELGKVMCLLFNKCINQSTIPDEWKITYVTPVPKPKNPKSNSSNYSSSSSSSSYEFKACVSRKTTITVIFEILRCLCYDPWALFLANGPVI